ncbi:hypothetical protein B0J12DRAFT_744213 [Macrophomina phaseolina]|uniref:Centrosomin N-terminal motif 1 domain-containing protein n=1 Tax=Macrophomina phaseolina TaxID=35725 RepID=A0ABQ8G1Q9_9PEZI|nr:hypothetical protein B0J12DRAFT_744213 [Macrophomina phaseolina]
MAHTLPFCSDLGALRTPTRASSLSIPTATEPKSEYLRLKLRERREHLGMPEQPIQHFSLSEPKPARGMDDYIFESEEDRKRTRRRPRGQSNRVSSLTSQYPSGPAHHAQCYSMGSREQQTNMDKMSKDNFDLKLRLTLVEERSHRLEAELEDALEKIDTLRVVEEERDELHEENINLCDRVEDLQQSKEACEEKLRDSWKMNGEIFAELEKRDAAIKEALDMYLDSERRTQSLELELAKHKAVPRHRDSSYFSSGPDSAGPRSTEEFSRPPTSRLGARRDGLSSAPASPEHPDTVSELAISRQPNPRYSRLIRTMSAGEMRLNDLRERATTANGTDPAVDGGSKGASSIQHRRTLRRSSGSPQMERASSRASSSAQSRGLRSVFLEGERGRSSPVLSESICAPSDVTSSSDLGGSQHLRAATPEQYGEPSRSATSPSPFAVFTRQDDADGAAFSERAEGTVIHNDRRDTIISDTTHFEEDFTTPTASEAPTIPTEYRPGQYPQWPGTGGKYGFSRDMFFNGEGLEELRRCRPMG